MRLGPRIRAWSIAVGMLVLLGGCPAAMASHDGDAEDPFLDPAYHDLAGQTGQLLALQRLQERSQGAVKAQAITRLEAVVAARSQALQQALLDGRRSLVLRVLLDQSVSAQLQLPDGVRRQLERWVQLTGTYEFFFANDFEQGIARYEHWLTLGDGQRYRLYPGLDHEPKYRSGTPVRASGAQIGAHLALPDDPGALSADGAATATDTSADLAAPTIRKVGVIMFNFLNSAATPYTADQIRAVTWTNPSSVRAWYEQVSFGKLTLQGKVRADGDVFGWYTIPHSADGSCNYSGWGAAARSAAAADGNDLTGYTNIIHVFPGSGTGCGWAGLANIIGGSTSYSWVVSPYYDLRVVTHELGHNYGAHHSSSYTCTDAGGARVPISGTCTMSEYGDPFDVMGGSTNHTNNFHKGQMYPVVWLDGPNMLTVTAGGRFTIAPIEQASLGVQSLRIPRARTPTGSISDYYYLEFRQPFGFDNFSASAPVVNGVLIRIAPDYASRVQSKLIDATTPALTGFGDAALGVGQTFFDPVSGVSVTTVSVSSAGAVVDIAFPPVPCVRAAPTVTLSPASQWGAPGQTLGYTATVRNNDNTGCGASTFLVSPVLPAGWAQAPETFSELLDAGQAVSRTLLVTSEAGAAEGAYVIRDTAVNQSAPTWQGSGTANYNVALPDTTPPSVAITSPAAGATVSGKVAVQAAATDNVGVSLVHFRVDGTLKASDSTAPYSFSWSANGAPAGPHMLSAEAVDAAGNSVTHQITVTVQKAKGRK